MFRSFLCFIAAICISGLVFVVGLERSQAQNTSAGPSSAQPGSGGPGKPVRPPQPTRSNKAKTKTSKPPARPPTANSAIFDESPNVLAPLPRDAFGQPQLGEHKLAGPIDDATEFLLHSPDPTKSLNPLGVVTDSAVRETPLEWQVADEDKKKVAVLRLNEHFLVWTWDAEVVEKLGSDELVKFERSLCRLLLEVSDGNVVLQRFQFAKRDPIKIKVPYSGTRSISLTRLTADAELQDDNTGGGWIITAISAERLEFSQNGLVFGVEIEPKTGTLKAAWGKTMDADIKLLEKDLSETEREIGKAKKNRDRAAASQAPWDVDEIDKVIRDLAERKNDLITRKRVILDAWEARKKLDISSWKARVVLANGVVLYTLTFARS